MEKTSTREEIRAAFDALGLSVTEWARAHNFRRDDVYALLNGRTRGRRGEAHRIATALGLKTGATGTAERLLNRQADDASQVPQEDKAP